MPDGDGAGTAPAATPGLGGSGSLLPWHLMPNFEPGETDLADYSRRLEFLAGIWPQEFLNQLAPRAALQCRGSAFQKVMRLSTDKLKVNNLSGVQLLVKTLGGAWGKTVLKDKYEKFERAIYGISQKNDESNESYVARHEVVFEDVLSQGATIEDMRAYITKASLLAGVCFPLGMYWGQSFWRRSDLSHRNVPFKWFNHLILTPPPLGGFNSRWVHGPVSCFELLFLGLVRSLQQFHFQIQCVFKKESAYFFLVVRPGRTITSWMLRLG